MIDEMKFECDLFILESGRGGAMGEAAPHRRMEQAHDMVSLDVGLVAEEGAKSWKNLRGGEGGKVEEGRYRRKGAKGVPRGAASC